MITFSKAFKRKMKLMFTGEQICLMYGLKICLNLYRRCKRILLFIWKLNMKTSVFDAYFFCNFTVQFTISWKKMHLVEKNKFFLGKQLDTGDVSLICSMYGLKICLNCIKRCKRILLFIWKFNKKTYVFKPYFFCIFTVQFMILWKKMHSCWKTIFFWVNSLIQPHFFDFVLILKINI